MRLSDLELNAISQETGHQADMMEKVIHLLNLLSSLNTHPALKGKWVLKGGTALNVFALDLPRLSVDIDLNYIGSLDREIMLAERPKIDQAIQAVFERDEYVVKRVPVEHAGGKWRLRYMSFTGQQSNLEVDLNFMLRRPLWDIQYAKSRELGKHQATGIPVLDIHEIATGKLAALMDRGQARDLFDCTGLFEMSKLDIAKLRLGFVVYGAMSRRDWRTISADDIEFDPGDINSQLIPTLDTSLAGTVGTSKEYGSFLVESCQKGMKNLLPFSDGELQFLDAIHEEGVIDASFLTEDPDLQSRINEQPMLKWKALNVRKHKGLD